MSLLRLHVIGCDRSPWGFGSTMRAAVTTGMLLKSPIVPGIVELPALEPKRERFLRLPRSNDWLSSMALEHPPFYRPLVYTLS